jgi:hypothetical protein
MDRRCSENFQDISDEFHEIPAVPFRAQAPPPSYWQLAADRKEAGMKAREEEARRQRQQDMERRRQEEHVRMQREAEEREKQRQEEARRQGVEAETTVIRAEILDTPSVNDAAKAAIAALGKVTTSADDQAILRKMVEANAHKLTPAAPKELVQLLVELCYKHKLEAEASELRLAARGATLRYWNSQNPIEMAGMVRGDPHRPAHPSPGLLHKIVPKVNDASRDAGDQARRKATVVQDVQAFPPLNTGTVVLSVEGAAATKEEEEASNSSTDKKQGLLERGSAGTEVLIDTLMDGAVVKHFVPEIDGQGGEGLNSQRGEGLNSPPCNQHPGDGQGANRGTSYI